MELSYLETTITPMDNSAELHFELAVNQDFKGRSRTGGIANVAQPVGYY